MIIVLNDELILPEYGLVRVRKIVTNGKGGRTVYAELSDTPRTLRQRVADVRFAQRSGRGWWR